MISSKLRVNVYVQLVAREEWCEMSKNINKIEKNHIDKIMRFEEHNIINLRCCNAMRVFTRTILLFSEKILLYSIPKAKRRCGRVCRCNSCNTQPYPLYSTAIHVIPIINVF